MLVTMNISLLRAGHRDLFFGANLSTNYHLPKNGNGIYDPAGCCKQKPTPMNQPVTERPADRPTLPTTRQAITDELAFLLGKQSKKSARAYDTWTQTRIKALRQAQASLPQP